MLVLPFFFVAVSGGSEGPVAIAASAAVDVAVNAVEGEPAVFEARRLRGLAGEEVVAAWALEPSAGTGGWLEEICADILVGDAAEADDLCRLCAGGDLKQASSEPVPYFSREDTHMTETRSLASGRAGFMLHTTCPKESRRVNRSSSLVLP